MTAEIVTIGDEILLGQTIDSNSAFIGKKLHALGVQIQQITSVSDTVEAITKSINDALSRVDLVLVTGGLGPTKDDITKQTLCAIFETTLVRNQEVYDRIEAYFKKLGREMLEVNAQQADLPEAAKILRNDLGTAQGMLFEKNGKLLLSMPGVPYEMMHIVEERLTPIINERMVNNQLFYQSVITKGLPESFLAHQIETWENRLRSDGFSLAYLPSPGIVKLRIGTNKASENNKNAISNYVEELKLLIPGHIFAFQDTSLDKVVTDILLREKYTLSIAESCTGGNLSSYFVNIPGISDVFLGSVVAYSNEMKVKLLQVPESEIAKNGAVSQSVVCRMALNMKKLTGSDFALATSGIAGPSGGTEEKPVGLVHMAIAAPDGKVYHFEKVFGGDRERIINRACQYLFSEFYDVLVARP